MKRLILIALFVLQASLLLAQTTPYRIRLPDSTYTSILVGVTSDDTVSGAWSTTFKMHEYIVTETDMYKRYDDPAGGTTYSEVTGWGKTTGKFIAGWDVYDFFINRMNSSNEVLSIGLGDTSVATATIKNDAVDSTKIKDASVFTQHLINSGVTTAKILDGTIAAADVGTNVLTEDQLSITTQFKQFMARGINITSDASTKCTIADVAGEDSLLFTWPKLWILNRQYYVPLATGTKKLRKNTLNIVYLDADINVQTTSSLANTTVKVASYGAAALNDKNVLVLFVNRNGMITTSFAGTFDQTFTPTNNSVTPIKMLATTDSSFKQFNPRNQALWLNSATDWEWTASLGTTPDSSQLKWPIFWIGFGDTYTKFKADSFRIVKNSQQRAIYMSFDESATDNSGTQGKEVFSTFALGSAGSPQYDSDKFVIGMVYDEIFTPRIQIPIADYIRTSEILNYQGITDEIVTPSALNDSYVYNYNNVGNNIKHVDDFLYNYETKNTGADSLLIIVILGSSIFKKNSGSDYGVPDTTANSPGTWSKMQAHFLLDSLQYSDSDLAYYTRSNTGITWNGTWDYKFGQYGSYYTGGNKYRESYGNAAYSEITVTNCTQFAIIYEAKTDGDILTVTVNGSAPSALGLTGSDAINTNYTAGAGDDWIPFAHSYYSGLTYSTSYTFRFTKSSDTGKAAKIWGYMKWHRKSIHIVNNANSGSGYEYEITEFPKFVRAITPDLVINQLHDVNITTAFTISDYKTKVLALMDSLQNLSIEYLNIIPNIRVPENSYHHQAARISRLTLAGDSESAIDMYAWSKENLDLGNTYFLLGDGVHPNSTGITYYVDEILKVLKIKSFAGL